MEFKMKPMTVENSEWNSRILRLICLEGERKDINAEMRKIRKELREMKE